MARYFGSSVNLMAIPQKSPKGAANRWPLRCLVPAAAAPGLTPSILNLGNCPISLQAADNRQTQRSATGGQPQKSAVHLRARNQARSNRINQIKPISLVTKLRFVMGLSWKLQLPARGIERSRSQRSWSFADKCVSKEDLRNENEDADAPEIAVNPTGSNQIPRSGKPEGERSRLNSIWDVRSGGQA